MNRAFIFPGQGSQTVGMGKDFFDSSAAAKRVFNTVDETIGYSLSNLIFNGPIEELSLTTNAQASIMATSAAILEVILQKTGKSINQLCSVVAGHSLGEYTALYAAGCINLESAAKLLKIRADSMQAACPVGQGAMAACIGMEYNQLLTILAEVIEEGVCQIANDNVQGQIVISGHEYNIDRVISILKDTGYRAIKLNVSAPFHSDLIKNAELPMQKALSETEFYEPKLPIIANVTASMEADVNIIKENLIKQICGTVRWREIMDKLAANGITELVEIGPGKVLSGLAKKSKHNFKVVNVATCEDLVNFLKASEDFCNHTFELNK